MWKSRWPSWAFRPNELYGFCGRKATLNHSHALAPHREDIFSVFNASSSERLLFLFRVFEFCSFMFVYLFCLLYFVFQSISANGWYVATTSITTTTNTTTTTTTTTIATTTTNNKSDTLQVHLTLTAWLDLLKYMPTATLSWSPVNSVKRPSPCLEKFKPSRYI